MQNKILKLGLTLFTIAATAGLVLGATNAVTQEPIASQTVEAANEARKSVLPTAESFTLLKETDGDIQDIYQGLDAQGAAVGCTAKTTVNGYGGKIQVTVGVDALGTITGVNIGGSDFSETAGLGARTKEAWFGAQFTGKTAPIQLKKDGGDIDAVTSATISSRAVTGGVDAVAEYLTNLTKEGN